MKTMMVMMEVETEQSAHRLKRWMLDAHNGIKQISVMVVDQTKPRKKTKKK